MFCKRRDFWLASRGARNPKPRVAQVHVCVKFEQMCKISEIVMVFLHSNKVIRISLNTESRQISEQLGEDDRGEGDL